MSWVSLDIETVGADVDTIPDPILDKLVATAERAGHEGRFALSPFTGRVIVVGMQFSDNHRAVLIEGEGGWEEKIDDMDEFLGTEKEILVATWSLLSRKSPRVITYNGRSFDIPFLRNRSIVHGVRPSRDLLGSRYVTREHFDVLEYLTAFGSVRPAPSFDLACWSLGIESPKGGGIDGSKVGEFYNAGKIDEIAEYCLRDVRALADMYRKVTRC